MEICAKALDLPKYWWTFLTVKWGYGYVCNFRNFFHRISDYVFKCIIFKSEFYSVRFLIFDYWIA